MASVRRSPWSETNPSSICRCALSSRTSAECSSGPLHIDGNPADDRVSYHDLHGYSGLRLAQNPSDDAKGLAVRVLPRHWPVEVASMQHITIELCQPNGVDLEGGHAVTNLLAASGVAAGERRASPQVTRDSKQNTPTGPAAPVTLKAVYQRVLSRLPRFPPAFERGGL